MSHIEDGFISATVADLLVDGLLAWNVDTIFGFPGDGITGHTVHDLIGTHYQQDVDLDKLFIDVAARIGARAQAR